MTRFNSEAYCWNHYLSGEPGQVHPRPCLWLRARFQVEKFWILTKLVKRFFAFISWRYDHPLLVYLRNYLDEDQDGSVSQEEFVDKKALPLISSIFTALDQNSDNIVELSEAWMENVLSPKFIRFLSQELFKFGDLNRDNFLSNEDIPKAFRPGAQDG